MEWLIETLIVIGIAAIMFLSIPPMLAILEVVHSRMDESVFGGVMVRWVDYWIEWEERHT